MTVTIPDGWRMWHLQRWPAAGEVAVGDPVSYHCSRTIQRSGVMMDVVGMGETAQQAVDECQRATERLCRLLPRKGGGGHE